MPHPKRADLPAPYVASDIQPYKSIVTGEIIGSRNAHREHLKKHNLEEVGNEKMRKHVRKEMPKAADDMAQIMKEKGIIG